MLEYRAQFRGTPASVRDARQAIVDYARLCGFENAALYEIALAAGEALANAVEHGDKSFGFIDVVCGFSEEELVVDINDGGNGFDAESITGRHRDPDSIRGFGISIMHAVMDGVQFVDRGATVRLRKRRQSATASDQIREEA